MTIHHPMSHPLRKAEEEQLVLVTPGNRRVGTGGKMDVHLRGVLHRAFSIFLVSSDGRLLLQRRYAGKYHSGGLWANTCCGHPRPGERTVVAARRRLSEELGLEAALTLAFQTRYEAPLDHGLTENELVFVYVGLLDGEIVPNPLEVSATRLVSLDALLVEAKDTPDAFAYWLRHYLAHHEGALREAVLSLR